MKSSTNNKNNDDLKEKYNSIFQNNPTKFFSFNPHEESCSIIDSLDCWNDKTILEIGCGPGFLAAMLSNVGAKSIHAIDYSDVIIKEAKERFNIENIKFENINYKDIKKMKYDVVLMQGVFEHFDIPFEELSYIFDNLVKDNGYVITSSPSFLNPRGHVLMTLSLLLDVPISLTDLHFLCPFDFGEYCEKNNLNLSYKSTYRNWASGEQTIRDFNRRLRNALRDGGYDNSKVDRFLEWFSKAVKYFTPNDESGAIITYKMSRLKTFGFKAPLRDQGERANLARDKPLRV